MNESNQKMISVRSALAIILRFLCDASSSSGSDCSCRRKPREARRVDGGKKHAQRRFPAAGRRVFRRFFSGDAAAAAAADRL